MGACFKCFELGHQSKDCTKNIIQQQKENQVCNVMLNSGNFNELPYASVDQKQCLEVENRIDLIWVL